VHPSALVNTSSVTVAPSNGKGKGKDEQTDPGTAVSLLLSYVVYGASWSPRYELGMDTTSKSGKLTYRLKPGEMQQSRFPRPKRPSPASETRSRNLKHGMSVSSRESVSGLLRRHMLASRHRSHANSSPAKLHGRSVPSGAAPRESKKRSMIRSKEIEEECEDDYEEDLIDYSDEAMDLNFEPRDKDPCDFRKRPAITTVSLRTIPC
jgi:hypothetical protein